MKIRILLIIISLSYISCQKNKEVKKNKEEVFYNMKGAYLNLNDLKKDSLSFLSSFYNDISTLIAKSEVPQMEELDTIEQNLYSEIRIYKDSILATINPENMSDYIDRFPFLDKISAIPEGSTFDIEKLQSVLKNGDLNEYYTYFLRDFTIRQIDIYWLCLYFAEKFNYAPAYAEAFHTLKHQNYINSVRMKAKDVDSSAFEYVDEKQRMLAFYCLIKAYKNGCIYESKTLAYYIRRGLYLPKNIKLARKLEYIYPGII